MPDLLGTEEVVASWFLFDEDAGNVRVSLETATLDQDKEPIHLALVVDVLGEDVLVERVAGRAVDEQPLVVSMAFAAGSARNSQRRSRSSREPLRLSSCSRVQKMARIGRAGEALGVEQGRPVVVAQDRDVKVLGQVEAAARLGPVADDVAQAVDRLGTLARMSCQHRPQGFEVAVNVAQDGDHRLSPRGERVVFLPSPLYSGERGWG